MLDSLTRLPDTALLLIGSGERDGALRARIAELGLAERVRMTGQVDDDFLQRAYAQADVFCLPSLDRAEAFGMVLLEAMRSAIPQRFRRGMSPKLACMPARNSAPIEHVVRPA